MNSEPEVPDASDSAGITGVVEVVLTDEHGNVKQREEIHNLVTQNGNKYYMERAVLATGLPNQVTGMRLGTNNAAATPSGAGSFIGTYITGSNSSGMTVLPTLTDNGNARRATWAYTWPAGTATNAAIVEAVITNETPITNVQGSAANTVSRVVFTAVDKQALDTLTITWSHDLLGA